MVHRSWPDGPLRVEEVLRSCDGWAEQRALSPHGQCSREDGAYSGLAGDHVAYADELTALERLLQMGHGASELRALA